MENNYDELVFKIPEESEDYMECSDFIVASIEHIIQKAMDEGRNKIVINTNLKLGLPMENINKIAGPFVEAWAFEIFTDVLEDENNGQLQVRDIHYVKRQNRTVWEFCQMLDRKCIASRKKGFEGWYTHAKEYGWIKNVE